MNRDSRYVLCVVLYLLGRGGRPKLAEWGLSMMRRTRARAYGRVTVGANLLIMAGALFLSSCLVTPTQHARPTPMRTSVPLTVLMETPRKIKSDYAYPLRTRQIFAWGRHGAEWRVLPADGTNAYAGFTLKHAQDVDDAREGTYLSFRMKPCARDSHLLIGLVSGDPEVNGVMTVKPLAEHRVREWGGWGLFAFRLATFPDTGEAVGKKSPRHDECPMDWTNIRGVRLIARPLEDWAEPLIIRDVQIGPARPDMF